MLLQNSQFSMYIWTKNLLLQWKGKLEADRSCSLEDMKCVTKISLLESTVCVKTMIIKKTYVCFTLLCSSLTSCLLAY